MSGWRAYSMQQTIIKQVDVAIESSLLKAFSVADNYTKYIDFVDFKRVLPSTSLLLNDFGKYFELYPKESIIDWGQFSTQFGQNWHSKDLSQYDVDYYKDHVFPAVAKNATTEADKALLGLIEKKAIEDLTNSLQKGINDEELSGIIESYFNKKTQISPLGVSSKIKTMFDMDFSVLDKSEGIPWFLPSLQNSLMSITRGQLVVVSGDTGSGKSAFVASQVASTFQYVMKKKCMQPILLLNSEGTLEDAMARVLSNLLRSHFVTGFEQIVANMDKILVRCREKFGEYADNLKMVQLTESKGLREVVQYLKQIKPCILFIDITDTLATEEDPKTLKKLYDGLRLLSAEYCPIIATTQAGNQEYLDKDENKLKQRKWLTDKALYGSKQKGSAADVMIMIGQDSENDNLRYISVTKKKRGKAVNIVCELEEVYSNFKEIQY